MHANGLRVEGDRGETVVRPVQATDDPAAIGPVDLVLFCVKLWDVETTGEQIRGLIGAETIVIPLQNGVDASERLLPILGAARVLGGVAIVTGSIVAPGVVRQFGKHHRIIFGELDGQITSRAERIRDVCQAAGIEAVLSGDIQRARWEKFIMLVAISGLCALVRRPIGDLRDEPDIAPLIDDAMREVVEVGRACGVKFSPDALRPLIHDVPPNTTPSMAVDLRAGNRLELPWLAGKVVQLGAAHGVPTPVNRVVYEAGRLPLGRDPQWDHCALAQRHQGQRRNPLAVPPRHRRSTRQSSRRRGCPSRPRSTAYSSGPSRV
jgi:2-dehydropantoate 2-reductase